MVQRKNACEIQLKTTADSTPVKLNRSLMLVRRRMRGATLLMNNPENQVDSGKHFLFITSARTNSIP